MRSLWWMLFCLMVFVGYAQDTIYKRSGENVAAKVLEVNVKDISYKRMDLLDGPLMIVSKNEIRKIKYASGAVDSFAVSQEPPKIKAPGYQIPVYVLSNPNLITPSLRKGVYLYLGRPVSDKGLISLALQKNSVWNNKEINDHIMAYKTNKSMQYAIGYSGAAIGIAGLYGSLLAISTDSGEENVIFSMIAASAAAGIFISSQIVSFSYKLKRVHHSDKVMELYNHLSEK